MGAYYTPEDRRPPTTPQLALRVAILGFIALALFAIMFFRLWYLQVLAGDKYLAEANQNRARVLPIRAPRGDIVDRRGKEIVTSRLANVVQLNPRSLNEKERAAAATWGQEATKLAKTWLATHDARWRAKHPRAYPPLPPVPPLTPALQERFTTIGKVLDMRPETIQKLVIRSLAVLPYGAITLRIDVPRTMLDYLEERKRDYPGVIPDSVFVRRYEQGDAAAQLLGNVGEVSPDELKESHFRGVHQGTAVGKGGVEYYYDRYLRGRDGARKLQVDAQGQFVGELVKARRAPIAGNRVKLSLDLALQKAAQSALRTAIANVGFPAKAGAFVAMNPKTGEVYAMGSEPTFDPNLFTKPISEKKFRQLNSEENGAPLFPRATLGQYPTGSTFKPITALAALGSGAITPSYSVNDTGCISIDPASPEKCNAGKEANGNVDLKSALRVSSDVYFYTLGMKLNSARTETIQDEARALGLGAKTGIDLPGEGTGNIPDWKWRERISKKEAACRRKKNIPLGPQFSVYTAAARGCGISDMRSWSIGDNVNLSVGQGDVQATPLQMAVAYSTIAMNGRRPTPHVGLQVEDPQGRFVQKLGAGPAKQVNIDPANRQAVLDGLHASTSEPGGTSYDVWQGWDQNRFPVFGKTGTAETFDHGLPYDQSWYVCWIPDTQHPNNPGIVIAVTVEKGGFGAAAAAPAARLIASKFYKQKAEYVVGENQTR